MSIPVIAIWHEEDYVGNQYELLLTKRDGTTEIRGLVVTYLSEIDGVIDKFLADLKYTHIGIRCHLCAKYPRIW